MKNFKDFNNKWYFTIFNHPEYFEEDEKQVLIYTPEDIKFIDKNNPESYVEAIYHEIDDDLYELMIDVIGNVEDMEGVWGIEPKDANKIKNELINKGLKYIDYPFNEDYFKEEW